MKTSRLQVGMFAAIAMATTTAARAGTAAASTQNVLESHMRELYSAPMIPLWLCSLVLLTLILERFAALRARRILDPGMVDEISDLVGDLRVKDAQERAGQSKTMVGQAWKQGLHEFLLGGVKMEETLTNACALAFKPLKRNLQGIRTISVISPLLGLLGTVIGMVMVFDQVRLSLNPDKQLLSEGIMVALFTTVFGIVIAIPGIVCANFFSSRIAGFAESAEADIDRVRYRHAHALALRDGTAQAGTKEEPA
ncbi:MAG: MotA/TolQ/ExbB proton channel family protein [Lentisphaerae bacterium]|nr:MotA/TolQ/ExbB proton channel family protein [Lentisphaerota bacterium]